MRLSAIVAPDFVMGASTENGNRVGEITLGGTIGLLIFVGIFAGIFGAVAFLLTEPWLKFTRRWHGAAFAIFLTAIGGASVFDPDNRDFRILDHQELNVAMFVGLFVAYGLLIIPLIRMLEQRLPAIDVRHPVRRGWGYLILAIIGLQFLLPFFVQFFVPEAGAGGGGAIGIALGITLVFVTLASLMTWVGVLAGSPGFGGRLLDPAGYALMVAALLIGGVSTTRDIAEIITL